MICVFDYSFSLRPLNVRMPSPWHDVDNMSHGRICYAETLVPITLYNRLRIDSFHCIGYTLGLQNTLFVSRSYIMQGIMQPVPNIRATCSFTAYVTPGHWWDFWWICVALSLSYKHVCSMFATVINRDMCRRSPSTFDMPGFYIDNARACITRTCWTYGWSPRSCSLYFALCRSAPTQPITSHKPPTAENTRVAAFVRVNSTSVPNWPHSSVANLPTTSWYRILPTRRSFHNKHILWRISPMFCCVCALVLPPYIGPSCLWIRYTPDFDNGQRYKHDCVISATRKKSIWNPQWNIWWPSSFRWWWQRLSSDVQRRCQRPCWPIARLWRANTVVCAWNIIVLNVQMY